MAAPRAAVCALLALTCVRAEIFRSDNAPPPARVPSGQRSIEAPGSNNNEVHGCMYSGRWYAEGVPVVARDACLRCRCARAALSCARAACAPQPDPPPRRCAVLHRRGACCPELHCPDGVRSLELEGTGRLEDEAWDVVTPSAPSHVCVEDGSVFSAGSALASHAACEQCFCLRGARRCVRPRCLPPPPGCAPRPAPGACCPTRYYCTHNATTPAPSVSTAAYSHRPHDCEVNGTRVREGEQVRGADNCSQCFCLRGRVRCQPPSCAPALRGCTPLLRPGHCCPHQYHCPHHQHTQHLEKISSIISAISDNSLIPTKNDERSLRVSASTKSAFITKSLVSSVPTTQSASTSSSSTVKVKRKTSDPPLKNSSQKTTPSEIKTSSHNPTSKSPRSTSSEETTALAIPKAETASSKSFSTTSPIDTTQEPTTVASTITMKTETTTTAQTAEQTSTEQPENSVKIIINGTINCTAELSSTLVNTTKNEPGSTENPVQPRVPERMNVEAETTTLAPTEIITDRGVSFAEGDSFVINVTSSLNANSSRPPAPAAPPSTLKDFAFTTNMTKKPKEDYDYDYMEPTLPPSLPNLKIIPFVAADAVVEDEAPAKEENLPYPIPMMEREDKFPVYYPTLVEQRDPPFATRREDVYSPSQYPVFVSEQSSPERPAAVEPAPAVTGAPGASTARDLAASTPDVNLFSPPAETEGGFIPKGPGIIDEYYAVYPSTPAPVPHLTTSMQINPDSPHKVECVSADGRRVPEGDSVWVACSVCACAWGELHCAPRRCPAPAPGCRRRPATASTADLCCGEIICSNDNMTTPDTILPTRRTEITLNVTKVPMESESEPEIISELIPFDPPPDRSVPKPDTSTDSQSLPQPEKAATSEAVHVTPHPGTAINTSTSLPLSETKEIMTSMPIVSGSSGMPSTSTTTSAPEPVVPSKNFTSTAIQSQEYEDEDDDEGFSFGSVLKLLLSDNYDATTTTTKKKPSSTTPPPPSSSPRPPPGPAPTRRQPLNTPAPPFIPMQQHAYIPPKQAPPHSTVDRIDHLVLGEATAIKITTPRPTTSTFRPISTPIKRFTTRTSTRKPFATTRTTSTMATKVDEPTEYTPPPAVEAARPAGAGGGGLGGGGLLKLAGCNIYGRMYRVGRIIAELSTPCQECRCTELGVQCVPLHC